MHAKGWRLVDIAREIGCSAPMVGLMVRYALDAPTIRAAIRECRRCPVRQTCAGLGEGERFGVWGGVPRDPDQETALRREARARVRRAS